MSIPFGKYVSITSGVAAGANVRERDLILRVFTSSQYVGPGEVLEYSADQLAAISARFGAASVELAMATQYFAYVSPRMTTPQRIGFAAWRPTAVGATVFGNTTYKALNAVNAISAGALTLRIGDTDTQIIGVDMSGAASLTAAAGILQTAIVSAGITGALVTVTGSRFVVQVPAHDVLRILSSVSGSNDVATVLGLTSAAGAFGVTGSAAIAPVQAVQDSEQVSNNFGSFAFAQALQESDVIAVAAYNASQNIKYQYHVPCTSSNYVALQAALVSFAGCSLTYNSVTGNEWPELIPASILAATRYSSRASVQNYMFRQQAGISSSVSDGTLSDELDAIRVNYYGDTSSAGQKIAFYQRGVLLGTGTAPSDMNVYANEQWFKDAAGAALMGLQLGIGRIPANAEGVGNISNTVQGVIDRALNNGVISVEKTLTTAQRIYLTQATGDDLAWSKVQTQGYYLTVRIEPYVAQGGNTEYKAVYELFYSKDDAIRKIEGTHSLV